MKAHFSTAARSLVQLAAVSSLGMALSGPAHAVDGCNVLLCMASNWKNIDQCEPLVRQAMRDAALGRNWPSCSSAGASGSANQHVAPEKCPEQYRTIVGTDDNGRVTYACPFSSAVQVVVDGQPWSRTWWSPSGESVIEWLPAAKAALASSPGALDARFDQDHAAWVISEQVRLAAEAAAAAAITQGGGG
jgi:hypothetical protein